MSEKSVVTILVLLFQMVGVCVILTPPRILISAAATSLQAYIQFYPLSRLVVKNTDTNITINKMNERIDYNKIL